MRPVPLGRVNSASSMPILRITHSSESTAPVTKAMSGMSPSLLLRGRRVSVEPTTVFVHEATLGITTWRRQRPVCMTSGMFAPTGALRMVKAPFTSVMALTSGEPLTLSLHCSQATPAAKGITGAFGMNTRTFGKGSVPFGAYTIPLTVVVMAGVEQLTCWRQRPVQLAGMPHWLATRPPQVFGSEQPPHWITPPQPSPIGPQVAAPTLAQVSGTHAGLPHTLEVPPPPHTAGAVQLPQSSEPPQPSPAGPQLKPRSAQVFAVQVTVSPHTLEVPLPPQVMGVVQLPQSSEPPQPSPAGPQL